jgi:hypothetical protein
MAIFPGRAYSKPRTTVPLSTKHRSSLYQSLAPLVGEEEASALMDQFPASESDELATKQLRAEIVEARVELHRSLRRQTITTFTLVVGAMSVQTAVFGGLLAVLR